MRQILLRITIPGLDFSIPLYGYGAMMCLGFLSAIFLAAWRAKREGQSPDVIYNAALVAFFGGIFGARAFYVIQNHEHFNSLLDFVTIWEGGLTFYGGFLLAVLSMAAYLRLTKRPLLFWLDIMAPSTALGLAFGRAGCFLNGCCYGDVCRSPGWGITWPAGTIPWEHYAEQFLGEHGLASALPAGAASDVLLPHGPAAGMLAGALASVWSPPAIHATQLYAIANGLLLALLLHTMFRWKRRHGQIILGLAVLYGASRFFEEMLRDDEPRIFLFGLPTLFEKLGLTRPPGLTISENVALLTVAGGLIAYVCLMKSRRRDLDADTLPVEALTPPPAVGRSGKRRREKRS